MGREAEAAQRRQRAEGGRTRTPSPQGNKRTARTALQHTSTVARGQHNTSFVDFYYGIRLRREIAKSLHHLPALLLLLLLWLLPIPSVPLPLRDGGSRQPHSALEAHPLGELVSRQLLPREPTAPGGRLHRLYRVGASARLGFRGRSARYDSFALLVFEKKKMAKKKGKT